MGIVFVIKTNNTFFILFKYVNMHSSFKYLSAKFRASTHKMRAGFFLAITFSHIFA